MINPPGCSTPSMCLRAPLPPKPPPPLLPRHSQTPLVFISDLIGFVFSRRALVPAYLKRMVLPWSGSAACYDDCKYGSTVPGGYTICTCSFVFEYESKIPNFFLPSSRPLRLLLPPRSFFCRGLKQVCLSSVYSMCPLCPHAPRVPSDCPCWVCFVQEVGSIDVSLYVPVEHLWLLSFAAVNKHVLVEESETLPFIV